MDEEATVTIAVPGGNRNALAALHLAARRAPDKTAFIDAPDRDARGYGSARSVTYAEAAAIVQHVSRQLSGLELQRGDVIAIQLPNIIEAPLAILAAWQAGLVPCVLPLLWRLDEITSAFSSVRPRAALTVTGDEDESPAVTLGEAAARQMSLRFLLALGDNTPDGITPAGPWFEVPETLGTGGAPDDLPELPGEQLALVSWSIGPAGTWPVARTHARLAALVSMFEGCHALSANDVLLNPYPYTSASAVAGQLVAPLLAEATTVLHLPFDYPTWMSQLSGEAVTCAVAPAPVLSELEKRKDLGNPASKLRKVVCVWPNPVGVTRRTRVPELPYPTTDVHNFAELAILPRRRSDGADPALHPLDKVRADKDDPGSDVLLEMRIRGSVTLREGEQVLAGILNVRGASVPEGVYAAPSANGSAPASPFVPDSHGFIDTGIVCITGEASPRHFRCEKSADIFYHGGMVLAASELDQLYSGFPEFLDAAAFVIDDETIGDRIFAAVVPKPELSPSLERLKDYLGRKRVAPHKAPDQLVIVKAIPRTADGVVLRDQILAQV